MVHLVEETLVQISLILQLIFKLRLMNIELLDLRVKILELVALSLVMV